MKTEVFDVLVRHNVSISVVADVERNKEGFRLVAVRPKDGPLPDVSHLINGVYPDLAGIRRALVSAMKSSKRDTLDRVLLSSSAYNGWMAIANQAMHEAAKQGISIKDAPDEAAKVLSDGALLIYVDVPGWKKISMKVAPGDWSWRT